MNIAIIGSSGAIGSAFVKAFLKNDTVNTIYAFSRCSSSFKDTRVISKPINIEDEVSIKEAASTLPKNLVLDCVIVATGVLSQADSRPEKSIKEVSAAAFQKVFAINTIGPALVAKHFIGLLRSDKKSVFAVLSARVGSIADNRLGGWYAYRASKAALNMVIKSLSIEVARKSDKMLVIGLHPGTVDSELSKPFQARVKKEALFSPDYSVSCLIKVIDTLTPGDSGKLFAYDGEEIAY